jgi:hypothetical protein
MTASFVAATALAVGLAVVASAIVLRARGQGSPVVRLVLLVLIAGLVVGTATHIENLARSGLVPRPELPFACNVFWSALVIVDPVTALALLLRPRAGVVVVAGVMAIDVVVNLAVLGLTPPIAGQIAYTILALVSIPVIVMKIPRSLSSAENDED